MKFKGCLLVVKHACELNTDISFKLGSHLKWQCIVPEKIPEKNVITAPKYELFNRLIENYFACSLDNLLQITKANKKAT